MASPFEALLTIAAQYEPAGATRDFGHGVGSEVFDDRIERGSDGRQRAELLDQRVTRGHGASAEDRIALLVAHRLGTQVSVLVGEDLHQAHREAFDEVVDDIFTRGQIDIERFAFFHAKVGKAPVEHGLRGRDQLHDYRMVFAKRCFHRGDHLPEAPRSW